MSNPDIWNDDDFLPKGASPQHRDAFIQIYQRYFRQLANSDGFDIDKYPGDAKAAACIPYLDFEKEVEMLMELANHAIERDYNNRETSLGMRLWREPLKLFKSMHIKDHMERILSGFAGKEW
ncbi:uncharacterized protein LOC107851853 isoform X2 [Capsicum annuum]|uniref:uncharacterized protein LOC107851853 isoform X2 n=1 Tax=Capsicum annuum TaxID=4072 RepID=UPI0007BFE2E8|nr:uncharacterized protein LOC107851853 isoform X2 [Capsicum annuum]